MFLFFATPFSRTFLNPLYFFFTIFSFFSTLQKASCDFVNGLNINLYLLVDFAEIFVTKQRSAKLALSSLNTKTFFGWVAQRYTAPSRMIVEELEAKIGGRKKKNFVSIVGTTASPLLQKADTEQFRQILRVWSFSTQVSSERPACA